ncbi:ATP-binding protein [Streptomyces flaveolus]|uniref:ATP-binding protein n=1 Tax=Streptomyces flaveolus TaxID=67297 RepID=UPI0033A2905E
MFKGAFPCPLSKRNATAADGSVRVRRVVPDGCRSRCAGLCSHGHAPARRDRPSRGGALVRTARRFAVSLLARWGVAPGDQDSVLLIVGELAGNAAQHGRADMIVSLTFEGRAVCIEVADSGASASVPHSRRPDADDEHGRGVGIVGQWAAGSPPGSDPLRSAGGRPGPRGGIHRVAWRAVPWENGRFLRWGEQSGARSD